ncbi:MAG: serpin family protein [candidate division KSB1 bacterium]|nr:serpin family protein [candidate division KSB1 bacterium]MDZ7273572.1 serpin family protein [candidate division KSB1 bacterium]MDZ7286837.1 serpin family protein [candidate division KSB1 bacterium]MDZ7299806.1 serpin family protein [candidate division KSB1 bacterium]MDZ7309433.1 serpin family protein [candidate division KSB1 bacterium]
MKTKRHVLAALCGLSLLLLQCEHRLAAPDNRIFRELTPLEKQLVTSDNRFGLQLFREVVRQEPDGNIFLSPLSVAMALGMALNGAGGETFEAMKNTLALDGLSLEEINQSCQSLIALLMQLDPQVQFQIANSIWHRQEMTFAQDFIHRNKTYFNARVSGVDFNAPATLDLINAWVRENTHGRISQIVEKIRPEEVMFLINAIYFKGAWTYRFDPANTQADWFTTGNGEKRACRMMNHYKIVLPHLRTDLFQAVDLPYGDAGFRMTILLPHPGVPVASLCAALTAENWARWQAGFTPRELMLALPKFSMTCEMSLNEVLQQLGMAIAFNEHADFSRISATERLYITEVKHKTFVEVDENGTTAAAATSVGIGVVSAPPAFRVDRPFLFLIRDRHSQTILFIGKIEYPQ